MSAVNCVTGPGTAIVQGKFTGLAGCSDATACPNAARCLRADPALSAYRAPMLLDGKCAKQISAGGAL